MRSSPGCIFHCEKRAVAKLLNLSLLNTILLIVLTVFNLLGIVVTCARMEAEAFYRVTGRRVSTWDANWIELRVDADNVTDSDEKSHKVP